MATARTGRLPAAAAFLLAAAGTGLFVCLYVPLVPAFLAVLAPLCLAVMAATAVAPRRGALLFVFLFPLVNGLPYFFRLADLCPAQPALVLCLFYGLGWLLARAFQGAPAPRRPRPVDRPLRLFAVLIAVSAVITAWRYADFPPFIAPRIFERAANVNGVSTGGAIMSAVLFGLNYLTGLFFAMTLARAAARPRDRRRFLDVLLLSLAVAAGFGMWQHFAAPTLGNNPVTISQGLINATFKDAMSLAAVLSILGPVLLGIGLSSRGPRRAAALALFACSGYLLLYAGSKISLVSFLAVSAGFVLWSLPELARRVRAPGAERRRRVGPIAAAAVLVAGLAGLWLLRPVLREVKGSQTYIRLFNDSGNLGRRAATFWSLALDMQRDYPLTGVGVGAYIIEVANYAAEERIPVIPESAENYLLQVGSETGLAGLWLVVWIAWTIVRAAVPGLRRAPPREPPFLVRGLALGLLVFAVNALFHTYIGSCEVKYLAWLLAGLLLAAVAKPEAAADAALGAVGVRPGKKSWIAAVLLIGLFGGAHLWNSTHSLALRNTTVRYGLDRSFGLYAAEQGPDGVPFRWTRAYGGIPLPAGAAYLAVPLQAAHPDIELRPVKVRLSVIEGKRSRRRTLATVSIADHSWRTIRLSLPEPTGAEAVLLIEVGRTWNPSRAEGAPDARDLGVAVGPIAYPGR